MRKNNRIFLIVVMTLFIKNYFGQTKKEMTKEEFDSLPMKEISNRVPEKQYKTITKDSTLIGTIIDMCYMTNSHWYGATVGVIIIKTISPEKVFSVLYLNNELTKGLKINGAIKVKVKPLTASDTLYKRNTTCLPVTQNPICILIKNIVAEQAQVKCNIVHDTTAKRDYYTSTETAAQYSKGTELMMAFIKNNMVIPNHAFEINETIYFGFIVETNGKLTFLKMIKPFNQEDIKNEIIRVVQEMPKWTPGTCANKPVPSLFVLPMKFRIK